MQNILSKEWVRQIGVVAGISVLLIGFQATGYSLFSEPSAAPPGNNADAPLNIGGTGQTKLGYLVVNASTQASDTSIGFLLNKGQARFGVIDNKTVRVMINGKIHIIDGSQAANKVLASDANGIGTWKTLEELGSGGDPVDKCGSAQNCTTLPDGTMMQWGINSSNGTADGTNYVRLVNLDAAYQYSNTFSINVTPAGTSNSLTSQNCTPGIRTGGNNQAFYIFTDASCTGVTFYWQTIGR